MHDVKMARIERAAIVPDEYSIDEPTEPVTDRTISNKGYRGAKRNQIVGIDDKQLNMGLASLAMNSMQRQQRNIRMIE